MPDSINIASIQTQSSGPVTTRLAPSLEPIATVALEAGRLLVQSGANARSTQKILESVGSNLGADTVEAHLSYASLGLTVGVGKSKLTHVREAGPLGVNHRLDEQLWNLARRVSSRELNAEQAQDELARIGTKTPRHRLWVTALATGLACGAFGRLLGLDWPGFVPVVLGATIGQRIRSSLAQRGVNGFISAALVALVASAVAIEAAALVGSQTVGMAMIASVLLLVPGIPAVNAQSDILDGYAVLGSARAVTVITTMVFVGVGLWVAHGLLHIRATETPVVAISSNFLLVLHQTFFGAVAAVGFGVLFNVGFGQLPWCATSGALALMTRTCCQCLGLSLPGAAFIAALIVRIAAQLRFRQSELSRDVLGAVGGIPMVPGAIAERGLLGLFALISNSGAGDPHAVVNAMQASLVALFTTCAIGTGLAIPALLPGLCDSKNSKDKARRQRFDSPSKA